MMQNFPHLCLLQVYMHSCCCLIMKTRVRIIVIFFNVELSTSSPWRQLSSAAYQTNALTLSKYATNPSETREQRLNGSEYNAMSRDSELLVSMRSLLPSRSTLVLSIIPMQ
jgi:hypothetical protein